MFKTLFPECFKFEKSLKIINPKYMSFISHIKEAKGEVAFVKWPSKKQTIAYTVAIVVVSVIVAAYLGALDVLFSKILAWLIS